MSERLGLTIASTKRSVFQWEKHRQHPKNFLDTKLFEHPDVLVRPAFGENLVLPVSRGRLAFPVLFNPAVRWTRQPLPTTTNAWRGFTLVWEVQFLNHNQHSECSFNSSVIDWYAYDHMRTGVHTVWKVWNGDFIRVQIILIAVCGWKREN